jgi:hypothetical protein
VPFPLPFSLYYPHLLFVPRHLSYPSPYFLCFFPFAFRSKFLFTIHSLFPLCHFFLYSIRFSFPVILLYSYLLKPWFFFISAPPSFVTPPLLHFLSLLIFPCLFYCLNLSFIQIIPPKQRLDQWRLCKSRRPGTSVWKLTVV